MLAHDDQSLSLVTLGVISARKDKDRDYMLVWKSNSTQLLTVGALANEPEAASAS